MILRKMAALSICATLVVGMLFLDKQRMQLNKNLSGV